MTAAIPKDVQRLTAIRLTILPRDPETAKADSEWGFVLSHIEATIDGADQGQQPLKFVRVIGDEPHPFKNPDDSLNPKTNNGFAAYSRIHYPRTASLVLESPVEVPEEAKVTIRLRNKVTMLGAFPLVARRGRVAVTDQTTIGQGLAETQHVADREQLADLVSVRAKIPSSRTPIMRSRPEHLRRPTHVFIRGLFLTKDKQVAPGMPAALPPLPKDAPANRLTLARWLVSNDNPLTAWVTVNRIWARLFGIGLVATEEDFGSSGEPPVDPDLLDHLATQFQGPLGWSTKRLLRSVVLSSVYRQDAKIRHELLQQDPQNRLLAHGPRFRMPAEMIRDSALAASGLLSTKMHGKPVHPPIPAGIWKPFQGGDKWNTPKPDDPDRYRRSIYTYTKRSIPFPMFAAFDAPSREFCTPRRLRSNTPLQALMTLNDVTFVECSRALASKMIEKGDQPADQIRYGFLSVATRMPNQNELTALVDLYGQCREEGSAEVESMTAVASVLLNLDEITSK